MLEVEGIHTFYGLSHILFDVSLNVAAGQVVCLLGRNGAGKTTTLKSIIGLTPPAEGRIRFNQEDITGTAPYRLVRKGIGYVPDDRRIFADLTVGENLEIAARIGPGSEGWDKPKVYELFPALKSMDGRKGGHLSGGEQKMLAIARAPDGQSAVSFVGRTHRRTGSRTGKDFRSANPQIKGVRFDRPLGRTEHQIHPGLERLRLYHRQRTHLLSGTCRKADR
jgi:ABC-type cobalamin/Fe3+-siderophores transport system ATPase subunit